MTHLVLDRPGPVATTTRSRLIDRERWRLHPAFTDLVNPAAIDDILVTFFRYPRSDNVRGYWLYRSDSCEYDQRSMRFAHLFTTELRQLFLAGMLEPHGTLDHLPPRLRRLAPLMLGGLSQKHISQKLDLSYHTVRSYARDLYGALGVNSREELTASLRAGQSPEPRVRGHANRRRRSR